MSAGGDRILVVDDDRSICDVMVEMLSFEGYAVDAACGGAAALERLRGRKEYALLLTDILMPDMNGIELIKQARAIRPSIIPIVMTGYATLESARAAVKEGAYDYVLKPFNMDEIKHAVSNALERHELSSENARLRELTELFRISESIATIHNEKKLLDFVLRAAMDRVGAERGSIMLATDDGHSLQMAAGIGVPAGAADQTIRWGDGISGWVAQHSLPLCVRDIHDDPEFSDMSRGLSEASFISVPLVRMGNGPVARSHRTDRNSPRVFAVLNVTQKKNGEAFTESDLRMLNIMANHASVALENVRLIRDIEQAHLSTIQSMALVLEAKDPYTHGHSQRVRNYAVAAAMKLGMSKHDVEALRLGAMLHDVGKIGVADTILNKVEQLGEMEWRQIKQHPVIGYEILEHVGFLTERHLDIVRSHHERLDGSGYPDGLCSEQIDDLVRIIAVADTYDAMSGDRAYRRGLPIERIVGELHRCAGAVFDRRIAHLFIRMIESGEIARFATREPQLQD